jgi:hypothetical protein
MWIISIILNDSVDEYLADQQLSVDFKAFIDALLAEGAETSNRVLPPHATTEERRAAFAPGVVYKRAWDLESSAQAAVDFLNNIPNKQATATFDGQQDI